jgi:dienelactone hydrolase
MSGAFVRLVLLAACCGALVACSSLGGTRSPITDTDFGQPGPFGIGNETATYPQALPNGQTRYVAAHIWYPAQRVATSTEVVAPGGPFPLVVFSPGTGATAFHYTFFLGYLASHGFVVAGLDDEDCRRAQCTEQERALDAQHRPADVSLVLDGLLAQNASDQSFFKNLIDPERIGVAGQSFGGWATLHVLEADPRFRAGLSLNPGTLEPPYPDPRQTTRPLMLMAGTLDARVPYALTAGYFNDIPASAPDHYLLTIQQAGHEFHNVCPDGFVTTGCASSMPHDQLQRLINRVGTAFLARYVGGRPVTDAQLGLSDATSDYQVVKAPADAPGVAPTARPLVIASATPAAVAGTALLEDTLSQAAGGKLPPTSTDPGRFTAAYAGGKYEITVNRTPGQGEIVLPGTYADTSIAVDVEMVNPTPNQFVQLACRVRDATSLYRFTFNPATGGVLLVRWLPVPGYELPRIALTPLDVRWPAMNLGSAVNHAELSCRGTTITARLNGTVVASVTDNSLAAGQLWIATGEAPAPPGQDQKPTARFSNLVVRQE